MRRPLALCAVAALVVACAKSEQKPDSTPAAAATPPAAPALTLNDLAGTWESQVMPVGKDTVLFTATQTNTATMDGWTLKLPNGATPTVKVVALEGDSVVTESGPFPSQLRKGQQVTTHAISRLKDGKFVSIIHAKYANGDTATFRMVGTKK